MAIEWEHDLRSAITEAVDETGATQFIVNPQILDYFLQTIAALARDKGVHIEDDADLAEIQTKLKQLIGVMEIIREGNEDDHDLTLRTAYAYALAYSLAMPDTEEKADELYKLAHSRQPDQALTNYLYGMFLFGNKKRQPESAPFLERALELGLEQSRFTLGMLYIQMHENEKGEAYLKQFAEDNPENQHAQLIYEAVRHGNLDLSSEGSA